MTSRYTWIRDLYDEEVYLLSRALSEYELEERKELLNHVRGYGHKLQLELLQELAARKLEKSLFTQEKI